MYAQVKITQSGQEKVSIDIDGKPFADFWVGAALSKPYLSPLRTASGIVVTRGYPMTTEIPGENHDHPHHRGLWFTHGDVNGYDFWANEESQKGTGKGKGRVVLKKLDQLESGPKSGTVAATFDWQIPGGQALLTETRRMTFYSHPQTRTIDFDITLTARDTVTFGDTKEGTFAIRLAAPLEEVQPRNIPQPKRTGQMVSAQGAKGERNIWGKRSAWVDYVGQIDGQTVGIAILDHPSNPRHPTYWHARAYGLFATNIFGVHDFENDKTRDGKLTLQAGKPLRFRYRVVIHPGDTESARIKDHFAEYSAVR
jgi:hypothetical protein